jgi:hypothetical protein
MSWHFSQALVAAYSRAASSDGEQSAPLSMTGTDAAPSWPARTMAASSPSPSGTSGRSTGSHGADVLTWFLAGFPVRPIPRRLEAATSRTISGRKCGESWQRQLPGTYLPRTSPGGPSTPQPTTSRRWGYETRCIALSASDMGADHGRPRYWLAAHADRHSKRRRSVDAEVGLLSGVCARVWEAFPGSIRVPDGVAGWVDRLAAAGDGQVAIVAAAAWRLMNATDEASASHP